MTITIQFDNFNIFIDVVLRKPTSVCRQVTKRLTDEQKLVDNHKQ